MLQMKVTFFTGHLCLVAKLGQVTYMYFWPQPNRTNQNGRQRGGRIYSRNLRLILYLCVREGSSASNPTTLQLLELKTVHVSLSGAHKHGENQPHFILHLQHTPSPVTCACNSRACGCKSHDPCKAARSHSWVTGGEFQIKWGCVE